jgi:hypothetical protein
MMQTLLPPLLSKCSEYKLQGIVEAAKLQTTAKTASIVHYVTGRQNAIPSLPRFSGTAVFVIKL